MVFKFIISEIEDILKELPIKIDEKYLSYAEHGYKLFRLIDTLKPYCSETLKLQEHSLHRIINNLVKNYFDWFEIFLIRFSDEYLSEKYDQRKVSVICSGIEFVLYISESYHTVDQTTRQPYPIDEDIRRLSELFEEIKGDISAVDSIVRDHPDWILPGYLATDSSVDLAASEAEELDWLSPSSQYQDI